MSALFSKKNKIKNEKRFSEKDEVVVGKTEQIGTDSSQTVNPKYYDHLSGESAITGFYVSEKAGLLNGFNQYLFKVSGNSNKGQLSKEIEKMFDVKVESVKIMNTKRKIRSVGRHSGFKPGFKKAVIVLKKGYTIEQAKA